MTSILTSLFGDLKRGRMGRMAFVVYLAALHISVVLYAAMVGMGAGLAERATDLDFEKAQQQLSDYMSPPFMLLTGVFLLAVVFAQVNILAKRIRDIGLPGWWVLLAYIIVRSGISAAGYTWFGLLLEMVAILVICVVNSDALPGNSSSSPPPGDAS